MENAGASADAVLDTAQNNKLSAQSDVAAQLAAVFNTAQTPVAQPIDPFTQHPGYTHTPHRRPPPPTRSHHSPWNYFRCHAKHKPQSQPKQRSHRCCCRPPKLELKTMSKKSSALMSELRNRGETLEDDKRQPGGWNTSETRQLANLIGCKRR